MAKFDWPEKLEAQSVVFGIRNSWASGGRNMYGREQRVFSDAGFWGVTIGGIFIRDRATHYAYNAMIDRLRMGDAVHVPAMGFYPMLGSADLNDSNVVLAADADLRATVLRVASSGIDIQPGAYIGIGKRLHRITEIISGPKSPPFQNQIANGTPWSDDIPFVDRSERTATYRIRVMPPLRGDYREGVGLRVRNPVLPCVLANAGDGDLEMQAGKIGFADLNLVEDFS